MSIVTFWNEDKEQTGKTLSAVAVATKMSIERNFKILLLTTGYKENTVKNGFWIDNIQKRLGNLATSENNIAVENGIEGLSKLVSSNKVQPSVITDYTKVIFKGRLEILNSYTGDGTITEEENLYNYKKVTECYPELIRLANQYYDIVIVDLDNRIERNIRETILELSNVNVLVLSQRLASLNNYKELKVSNKYVMGPKCIPIIGKYNRESKYNKKNIMRFLEEKRELNVVPFSTLYFESAEETGIPDFFLKMRDIKDKGDENYFFMTEVLCLANNIITRLKELQMRMR